MKKPIKIVALFVPIVALVFLGFFLSARSKAQMNQAMFLAAGEGDNTRVKELIESGANPSAERKDDKAGGEFLPLHIAAMEGHDDVVQTLLAHGADANAPSFKHQITPLQMAVTRGRASTIRILLAKGADPNRKDKHGRTALDNALSILKLPSIARSPHPEYQESVRILQQANGQK